MVGGRSDIVGQRTGRAWREQRSVQRVVNVAVDDGRRSGAGGGVGWRKTVDSRGYTRAQRIGSVGDGDELFGGSGVFQRSCGRNIGVAGWRVEVKEGRHGWQTSKGSAEEVGSGFLHRRWCVGYRVGVTADVTAFVFSLLSVVAYWSQVRLRSGAEAADES